MTETKINIALVDDHAIVRSGLAGLINSISQFNIIMEADNGQDLMQKLSVAITKPDVCILDINMPQMNGYETAKAIRAQYDDIRILALSMYDSELSIIKMLKSGAVGYLLKNARPQELKNAIESVYQHGFYYSDLVSPRRKQMLDGKSKQLLNINENEERFLSLCCSEYTYKEIADQMFKSVRTIDGYREDLFLKLNVSSRVGLALYALKCGLGIL